MKQMNWSAAMKQYRETMMQSVTAACVEAGISRREWQYLEAGKHRPNTQTRGKLTQVFALHNFKIDLYLRG